MSVRVIALAAVASFLVLAPGAAADPVFSPDPLEFPDQLVGTESGQAVINVTGDGPDPYEVSDVFLDGDDPGDFEIVDETCTDAVITQSTGCSVNVRFRPTASGDRLAVLVLDNAGGGDAFGVLVGGFAYDQPTVEASPLEFSPVRRGSTTVRRHVQFVNSGDGPVHFGAASISGPDAAAFTVPFNNCTGQAIAPGGSCVVDVTFKPAHDGKHTAELALASDAADAPHRVSLSGTGLPEADIQLEAPGLDFGTIGAPFGEVTREIVVRNLGDQAVRLVVLEPILEPAGHARITQNTCAKTLFGRDTCRVSVTVTPLRQGALSGTLRVQGSSTQAILASIPLSGEVAGDPSAYMQSSLEHTLASAARAWRRAGRRALRRGGFRMPWTLPFGGIATLRVYAEVPGASARGRRLIARVYDGVGPQPGERQLRARITRTGRRILARAGRLRVVPELRFRLADGRAWTVSRRVRLR